MTWFTRLRFRLSRRQSIAVCAALVLAVLAGDREPAGAQTRPEEVSTGSFIAQFPESEVYRVQLVGDAFAEGLAQALADSLQQESRFQVNRKHRAIGGLVRAEWEDDIKAEDANRETAQIIILMTGLLDKQAIRTANSAKVLSTSSDDWKEEYARRFDRLVKAVRKRGTAVYVIGQPILKSTSQNTQAEMLTDLMRQRAQANGAKFIDIYEAFQDDNGGFSQFGPDISGNRVKLRESDGITFTGLGHRKLANILERDLKRDLAQAVSDRAIPLAGDEAEQKRVTPAKAAGGNAAAGTKGAVVAGRAAVPSQVPVAPQAGDGAGDQKADNGRVTLRLVNAAGREESATIEIVRPAIPAAVIALLTRRESAGERAQQPGEGVVEDIGAGLTVVNSVSFLGEAAARAAGKTRTPVAQAPFYQVLVKGERMPPKTGRADDFTWPRPDPFIVAAPAPAPSPAAGSTARPQAGRATVSPPTPAVQPFAPARAGNRNN